MTSNIEGVIIKPLSRYKDSRGWLTELYRDDELPTGFEPKMSYLSVTMPGVARGPHEHIAQTDLFAFLDGEYELYLWENRPGKTADAEVHKVGAENSVAVFVPP
ncbi:MAG: WxcM-like domain-containing protein, partial [Fimbriimonadaceae bacterium]